MSLHIILPESVIDPDFVKNEERDLHSAVKDCDVMAIHIMTTILTIIKPQET